MKMKFCLQNPQIRAPRLGTLKINGKRNIEIETPVVLIHTQGGHIPHVTHEVFKLVSNEPQILQIPLVSMHNFQETLEYYSGSVSEFIGSKDSVTCVTLQDPSNLTKQGHHAKEKIPVWTKYGKVFYNCETYMNMVESFKPDMYYVLSDGDTNKTSAPKRILKAVENTIKFNEQCLERHRKSDILKDAFVMAPIAGGYCMKSREKCIQAILKNVDEFNGFLVDGLHNNGPEVEFLPFEEVKEILENIVKNLPQEKLLSVQGCWNPVNVIKLVQAGIDMFDTSYCRILTERSAAMTFPIEENEESDSFEINLRQSKYIDDFTSIMHSCKCLTCTKYSRGYIHHLLTVQELLAPVLIMIHNIHHYLRFFKEIRKCIRNNTLDNFENRILVQYKMHQDKVLSAKPEEEFRPTYNRNEAGDIE